MKFGIACLSILPVRKEPSHRSEQVTQLLFGEVYEVLAEQTDWLHVKCAYDGYEGWMAANQHYDLAEKEYAAHAQSMHGRALDYVGSAASGSKSISIVAGSTLPFFDGINLKIGKEKFIYNHQAMQHENGKNQAMLEKIAMRYLHAPYLWGGRSPFGIDCSGFTQMVFKFLYIPLHRDAYRQAEQGSIVNFIEEAQPGDLAFFNNPEGKITHVGIVIKDNRIIHASGMVRIDKIDHFGIYNAALKKYTHQLKILKRVM